MCQRRIFSLSLYFCDSTFVLYNMRCVQSALCVLSVRFEQKLNCVSNACTRADAYAYVFYFRIYVGGGRGGERAGKRCGGSNTED